MASIPGFRFDLTGASGSQGLLGPKSSWRAYVFPRGGHASQDSTGTLITFDSAAVASRFAANNWIQVSLSTANIRQVSAVGGNSISVSGSNLTVAENDRIYLIGNTQPTVSGGSATYTTPNTQIRQRDDDAADLYTNSMITSNSDGLIQGFGAAGVYDVLIQDGNRSNVGSIIDMEVGLVAQGSIAPETPFSTTIGTCTQPFGGLRLGGNLMSGTTPSSGVTAHIFDTCRGWTNAGNLFAFGNTGTTVLYGNTWGGVFHSYNLPEVVNVKSARFGARGDGTTDDTTAIQNAITFATGASEGTGGIVFFPPGIYIVNSTLTVRSRCTLMGSGNRITVIRAGGSFSFNGTTDAIVTIGVAGTDSYGQVRHLQLDGNNISGSIGAYYVTAQENAGLWDFIVSRCVAGGIVTASGFTVQNITIKDGEIHHSASAAATYQGISLTQVSGGALIDNITINAYDGATTIAGPGIGIGAGTQAHLRRVHVERNTVAAHGSDTSYGTAIELNGGNAVRDIFRMDSAGWLLMDVAGLTVHDALNGISWTENPPNWYFLSNHGGVGFKSRMSSSALAPSYQNSPTTYGNTLTTSGVLEVDGALAGDVDTVGASNGGINISGRRRIIVTGTTTIWQFTGGIPGQEVWLIGQTDTTTLTRGFTLSMLSATDTIGPNDVVKFIGAANGVSFWQATAVLGNGAFA